MAARRALFAVRLHPQVRLRTVRRLGYRDRRVHWPKPSGPRWRGGDWPAGIDLRVVEYHVKGFRPSAVVTNVLDEQVVSRAEWVRLATAHPEGARRLDQGLYHLRWQIETVQPDYTSRQRWVARRPVAYHLCERAA